MAEAKINEQCIIGIPACGYAFNSTRMTFIAAPADEEFQLELDILGQILSDKEYEAYVALQNLDPARLSFCSKICSKIIQSQFCIILLNYSLHYSNPSIRIPNPNVHLEYGLMLAFHKYIIPMQKRRRHTCFQYSTTRYDKVYEKNVSPNGRPSDRSSYFIHNDYLHAYQATCF
jgi:hypothetical protein